VVGKVTFKGMCKEKKKIKKFNHEKQKHKFKLMHCKLGNQGHGKHLGIVVGIF
jgi:hypothetical protein